MIVREIKQDIEKILEGFDWFNDYEDTRNWLKHSFPEMLPLFDAGFEKWKQLNEEKKP